MKKTLFLNLTALIAVITLATPTVTAAGYGHGSGIARETLRVKRQLSEFCDVVNRYVHPRRQNANERYAMQQLADFDQSLDRLLIRVDKFGPRSLFLRNDASRIKTDFYTAKRYLKYLDIPYWLSRRFAMMEDDVKRIELQIDDRPRLPDYDRDRGPDRGPYRDRDRYEQPRNQFVNLKPYAEELEDEADDMLKHVKYEASQRTGSYENRGQGNGNRGRGGRSQLDDVIHRFQVLEDMTDDFEERVRGHYAWTRELAMLHARIEQQHRIAGRGLDLLGSISRKDHQTFGRYMNSFLNKYPYGRLGGGFGDRYDERDRYDDRYRGGYGDRDSTWDRGDYGEWNRDSYGDRERGEYGDRNRYGRRGGVSADSDESSTGTAWSVSVDF